VARRQWPVTDWKETPCAILPLSSRRSWPPPHLHLDSTGPPLAPARGDGADSVDRAPAYDVADPVYQS
jgi:hypothetical protein